MASASAVDPRVAETLGNLAAITLERHDGVVFEDQEVFLDGRDFVDCTFRRCRLVLLLGVFRFHGKANFVECAWRFGGPAEMATKLIDDVRANRNAGDGPVQ